jgi:hypothetical protein
MESSPDGDGEPPLPKIRVGAHFAVSPAALATCIAIWRQKQVRMRW